MKTKKRSKKEELFGWFWGEFLSVPIHSEKAHRIEKIISVLLKEEARGK